jgi:hypothetical protein
VVFQLGNTALGLHTFPQPPAPDDRFDEHRIGLDHVSFGCANREELQQWRSHLEKFGIVEHGGIKDASYGPGVSFRDPDNNALEFFCPPSTPAVDRVNAACGLGRSRRHLASTTASSMDGEAPCPEVGDGACAASPMTIIRPLCQAGRWVCTAAAVPLVSAAYRPGPPGARAWLS